MTLQAKEVTVSEPLLKTRTPPQRGAASTTVTHSVSFQCAAGDDFYLPHQLKVYTAAGLRSGDATVPVLEVIISLSS